VETALLETTNYATNVDYSGVALEAGDQSTWVSRDVEMKLLVDLVYILQGINGKHIRFDPRSESYVVDPALMLKPSIKDIVFCICELGWLYCRVSDYIKAVVAPNSDIPGLVVQAFCYGLQEELGDYFRLLAVLEQELRRPSSTLNLPRDSRSSGGGLSGGAGAAGRDASIQAVDTREYTSPTGILAAHQAASSESASGLTLLRLRAWMQDPVERMCLMARLVDSARSVPHVSSRISQKVKLSINQSHNY
jgi:hypothetical protein